MLRLISFFIVALAVAWAGVWVANNPGVVVLNWDGWRVDTSVGVLVVSAMLFAGVVALFYRFWLFLTRVPGRITHARQERRSQKGYKALTKGMVAVAAGDATEARRQVAKADGLLREPPLTLLLKAQAAQLSGDEKAAETFFKAMLKEPDMAFLGLRGLINQALKRGDDQSALAYVRRAYALKPKSAWLTDTRFALEARVGQWREADEALGRIEKRNSVNKDEMRHRRAVVLLGRSLKAEAMGTHREALKLAEKSVAADTAFMPAATHLARLHLARKNRRKARSVLEKTWSLRPHPDLATLYLEVSEAEDGLQKVKALKTLTSCHADTQEGRVALGEAFLEARLWGQARTVLTEAMAGEHATRAVYRLMARLEDEERGDSQQARKWLECAAEAAADPAWVCADCGSVLARWSTHCPKCEGFDTLVWKTPPGFDAVNAVCGGSAPVPKAVFSKRIDVGARAD